MAFFKPSEGQNKDVKGEIEKKILSEAEFVTRFGAIENNSLLYKLDRLVLTSGVKNMFPWMSGETFLVGMVLAAIAGFAEGISVPFSVLMFPAVSDILLINKYLVPVTPSPILKVAVLVSNELSAVKV